MSYRIIEGTALDVESSLNTLSQWHDGQVRVIDTAAVRGGPQIGPPRLFVTVELIPTLPPRP